MIGRFVTADSIIQDLFLPQTLNRYSYVRNNPLRYTDPTGHETTGEFIERKGTEAAAAGKNVAAYGWAFADAAWTYFGMESVSKVTDNVITDRGDLTGWDVAGAVVDVATLGKGGGAVVAGKKIGGKALSKIGAKASEGAIKGITKSSRKRIKRLATNLSKPDKNPGLSQTKLDQLRRITDKADAKVRVDLKGVSGSGARPHAHVEGMGSKVESRHIWLKEGVK